MMPLDLFRSRTVSIAAVVGFAFMVGYYGLPFVMSLYLQQLRGLSALGTGVMFVPMMVVGGVLTPFTARLAERFGARTLIACGLLRHDGRAGGDRPAARHGARGCPVGADDPASGWPARWLCRR